ncbi:MAG: endonuclease domain-containing protein [Thermoleophilaceae bacterium]
MVRKQQLPVPETQVWLNGHRVDFYWRDLGIVVEADSGRFHRTAAQQTRDRERDHAHLCAGLVPLRFTHAQITYRPDYVGGIIATARAGR